MSLNRIFDVAGSALAAQSVRLNTTASNLANAESAASSADQVYRSRQPVFAAIQKSLMEDPLSPNGITSQADAGVQVLGIVESEAPLQKRYEPGHPMADQDGYVLYPNVNVVEEMTNMISASRSFQTNVDVMEAAKTMAQQLLTMGQ